LPQNPRISNTFFDPPGGRNGRLAARSRVSALSEAARRLRVKVRDGFLSILNLSKPVLQTHEDHEDCDSRGDRRASFECMSDYANRFKQPASFQPFSSHAPQVLVCLSVGLRRSTCPNPVRVGIRGVYREPEEFKERAFQSLVTEFCPYSG